ncbi:uncharacterized protein I206_102171 [Kwoniella pini CBS 10737]|uniref:DUF4048 domain-containing protein n=1 Tax=Kwoniella pini CBS 10737 TaxID=1296096 RepID=A0A1B9HUL7_9TREE|nr:uncharacterized protein I206_06734 [Kwoniella pini CBS 10737]OCF46960.1 hypothetical protein I206_06734 [Kwoniella pini CBS 10737]
MSSSNVPSTPNHRYQAKSTIIISPSFKNGQDKMKRNQVKQSSDRFIINSGPAPPANLSRLHSSFTSTSGTLNKGLKPLGMTSSSSLNISPRSPSSASSNIHEDNNPSSSNLSNSKQDKRKSIIIPPSTPTIMDTEESIDQSQSSSRNKLKRLSLCSRPPSFELESIDYKSPLILSSPSPNLQISTQPLTPINGSERSRRPDRRMGLRASISYSPAIPLPTPRTAERKVFGRGDGWGMDEDVIEKRNVESEDELMDEVQQDRRISGVQTLAEKHADLLTHIAQRERRVAELKQELLAQENSLAKLKSRWTTIVSRSALSPIQSDPPAPTPAPQSRSSHSRSHTTTQHPLTRRPNSTISSSASASASTSSSSLSLTTIDEPLSNALIASTGGLSNTGAAVLSGIISQTEGYLSPEVVQGGKRFLGNLWKTVGAAAGGTIPEQESIKHDNSTSNGKQPAEENHGVPKLDLTNLQKLITPWDTPSSRLSNSSSTNVNCNHQQQQRNNRRANDRSNTVTPTSFTRRTPTSPPATVGLGFDLNIKPTSTISSNTSPKFDHSHDLLDDDTTTDNERENQHNVNLGKTLTPMKSRLDTTDLVKVISTNSSDDGWGPW